MAKIKKERTEKEARKVLKANEVKNYMVTTLDLHGNRWESFVSADGGPNLEAQTGKFSVEGNLIHMVDDFNGAEYTYNFELREDILHIGLVESNAPPSFGISDDAFQFAHYSAVAFERTAPPEYLNGTYRYTLTQADADKVGDQGDYPLPVEWTLLDGRFSSGLDGGLEGPYFVDRDRITFIVPQFDNAALTFTFSVDDAGNLRLEPVQPMDKGDAFVWAYKVWEKID